jgi:phage shock protein A
MSESLALRVKRLVSGGANAIVAAVEAMAPEMVMEEAIREIDRAVADVRTELGQVLTRQYHATQRLATENERHESLKEKIRIALKEGRDDLAEAGVAQLLDIEAQIPLIEATALETRAAQTELESFIAALQARKREMIAELNVYRSAQSSAETAAESAPSSVRQRVQNAQSAFDRVMDGAGGLGLGGGVPDPKTAKANAELEELARRNRIKERLAALKEE